MPRSRTGLSAHASRGWRCRLCRARTPSTSCSRLPTLTAAGPPAVCLGRVALSLPPLRIPQHHVPDCSRPLKVSTPRAGPASVGDSACRVLSRGEVLVTKRHGPDKKGLSRLYVEFAAAESDYARSPRGAPQPSNESDLVSRAVASRVLFYGRFMATVEVPTGWRAGLPGARVLSSLPNPRDHHHIEVLRVSIFR
jgi:hypothetical protein